MFQSHSKLVRIRVPSARSFVTIAMVAALAAGAAVGGTAIGGTTRPRL